MEYKPTHDVSEKHEGPSHSGRVDIFGVNVSTVNLPMALASLTESIETAKRGYVCVTDVNALLHASRDELLKEVFNNSLLTVPDGMPLVWAGRRAGASWMGRVSGPDLMPALLRIAANRGWSSYFLGGTPEVVERLLHKFDQEIPGFTVAGHYSPPFRTPTAGEDEAIMQAIDESGADLLWVGLGAPKQERWMGEHFSRMSVPLMLGVGGAFDMNSGAIKRAPVWMQRSGLEWSYRFSKEPRRLWSRYSRIIPVFIWSILRRRPRLVMQ